jgi:hypothetical protein
MNSLQQNPPKIKETPSTIATGNTTGGNSGSSSANSAKHTKHNSHHHAPNTTSATHNSQTVTQMHKTAASITMPKSPAAATKTEVVKNNSN